MLNCYYTHSEESDPLQVFSLPHVQDFSGINSVLILTAKMSDSHVCSLHTDIMDSTLLTVAFRKVH